MSEVTKLRNLLLIKYLSYVHAYNKPRPGQRSVNMVFVVSLGWGIACRYLLTYSLETRVHRLIHIAPITWFDTSSQHATALEIGLPHCWSTPPIVLSSRIVTLSVDVCMMLWRVGRPSVGRCPLIKPIGIPHCPSIAIDLTSTYANTSVDSYSVDLYLVILLIRYRLLRLH